MREGGEGEGKGGVRECEQDFQAEGTAFKADKAGNGQQNLTLLQYS